MDIVALCMEYKARLAAKDLAAVEALFAPDASVTAPISGSKSVRDFHAYLFANTGRTAVTFSDALPQRSSQARATLKVTYTFLSPGGRVGVIDGMAIFDVDARRNRIKSLRVLYDPTDIRSIMEIEEIPAPG